MKKMDVCVVTGSRAEFGIWRPVLAAIRGSDVLQLSLVVTGMHLQRDFGETVKDIVAAGYVPAAQVPMYESGEAPATSLARGIERLANTYRALKPDLVCVLGDRLEVLAAASAALAERIAIAHVHGGETAPGVWDEQIRHAVTKMAHLHFCATETARRRIVLMGEEESRVHRVGAPAIDLIEAHWQSTADTTRAPLSATVLLHPTGGSDEVEQQRAVQLLEAMRRAKLEPTYVVGPNNDPGHAGILRAYGGAAVDVHMSVPQEDFWGMLRRTAVLVGNSSSGIIEAASLGIPVVNVGGRQAGRERNPNVIDVGWEPREIEEALRRATSDEAFLRVVGARKNLYGDGHASERIVAVLEGLLHAGVPLLKRFCD